MTKIERGAVFIIAAKGAYTGKPRPAIVIQNDDFTLSSILILPITTEPSEVNRVRIEIKPDKKNGLNTLSYAMCDKISAIPITNLRNRIGALDDETMRRIESGLVNVLDLSSK